MMFLVSCLHIMFPQMQESLHLNYIVFHKIEEKKSTLYNHIMFIVNIPPTPHFKKKLISIFSTNNQQLC